MSDKITDQRPKKGIVQIMVTRLPHNRLLGRLPGGQTVVGTDEQGLMVAVKERLAIGGGGRIDLIHEGPNDRQ